MSTAAEKEWFEQYGLYDPANEHDACGVGFVANIKGRKSHAIVRDALQILLNLDHRGAVGADPLVGDGAGCLIQIPDALLRDWADKHKVNLPPPGHYAVAMCFLPQDAKARDFAVKQFQHFIKVEGQVLIGWRDVPTNTNGLGKTVLAEMPVIRQCFIKRGENTPDQAAFERKLLSPAQFEDVCSRIDYVVHSAAATGFGTPKSLTFRTNVQGTKNVVELASRARASFCHVSTALLVRVTRKPLPARISATRAANCSDRKRRS